MRKIIPFITLSLILAVGITSTTACGGRNNNQTPTADTITMQPAPAFNADSAFAFVSAQCDFGPRIPGSEAHQACGDYLVRQFTRYGATVIEQKAQVTAYDGTTLPARNIIAQINPEASTRLLVCGHWDSRPWADNDPNPDNHKKPVLAANDAASDVAVMLEMARAIQSQPLNIGVDFICFDVEDYGQPQWDDSNREESGWCLGSTYWASHLHSFGYKPRFGILMDMVGGRGASFAREGFSLQHASQVVDLVWKTASQLGHSAIFSNEEGGYITDDHVPVNQIAGIPCIDIVPYITSGPSSFGPTWHTVNDTPENIDPAVLKAVGETVLQVIYNENE